MNKITTCNGQEFDVTNDGLQKAVNSLRCINCGKETNILICGLICTECWNDN